jgi:hypothetical protein
MDAVIHVYVHLLAGHKADGDRVLEAVPAAPAGEPSTFRLTATPGLVEGTAAEDIVRVEADGSFDVVRRGATSLSMCSRAASPMRPIPTSKRTWSGSADSSMARWHPPSDRSRVHGPRRGWLRGRRGRFQRLRQEHPEARWSFGNVYDPADGVTPLNRWQA